MKLQSVQSYINPKTTGWASVSCLSGTILTGISKNKRIYRLHKPLAILTAITTISHIGIIEYYKNIYKQK